MIVKGWGQIFIIYLFHSWLTLLWEWGGRSVTHVLMCKVSQVPCEEKHRSSLFPFSFSSSSSSSIFPSPSCHLSFLTFEMGIASSHLLTSLWFLLCLCCFQLHSNLKGETGKSWSRVPSCPRAFRCWPVSLECLHVDFLFIHQKLAGCLFLLLYISNLVPSEIRIIYAISSFFPSPLLPLPLLSLESFLHCLRLTDHLRNSHRTTEV